MLEHALVVAIGGADQRAPEPGQREDRATAAGGNDCAGREREVRAIEHEVRAAARPDMRQRRSPCAALGLGATGRVGLERDRGDGLGGQLLSPDAGGVDDVGGANLEHLAALAVARTHAGGASLALDQLAHAKAIGADRAKTLGLAEDGEHQTDVVGLAVVEQVATGRLARGERGQQVADILARDHAVALRAPRLALGETRPHVLLAALLGLACTAPAARSQALAVDRHDVVQVQPHADQAIGAGTVEGCHHQRQGTHQVRRERDHQLALEQRLADQHEVELLQVAEPAVHQLARAARRARREIRALEQRDAEPARGGIERDARAGDAAPDHGQIEFVGRHRRESLSSVDHAPQSRRGTHGLGRPAEHAPAMRARDYPRWACRRARRRRLGRLRLRPGGAVAPRVAAPIPELR